MTFETKMNDFAHNNIPFIFILSYDMKESIVIPLDQAKAHNILYKVNEKTNYSVQPGELRTGKKQKVITKMTPVSFDDYKTAFETLHKEFVNGNTFLTNLTCKTKIESELTIQEIFTHAKAPYKLLVDDRFVLFSPETFIKTSNDYMYTYPMKGTIEADIPDAAQILENDEKEFAEHITVVDLLRNDLGIVSDTVEVTRFRYTVPVFNPDKPLLQTVSEIKGKISESYINRPGSLIAKLLPAGSITGAPKKKTVEIISRIENYTRGFYTGVFGIWENGVIDSAVMIRFIEAEGSDLYYKSGGGITVYSNAENEYKELLDKIYVPVY